VARNFPRTSIFQRRAAGLAAESGKEPRQGLENYILKQSAHARIQNLRRQRSMYTDKDSAVEESVRVPLGFWKVAVMEDGKRNKLRAA
jgi:DNA/RNA endonuclease G (NUC1)